MKKIALPFILVVAACSSHKVMESQLLPLNTCEAVNVYLKKDLDNYQSIVDGASADYQNEQWKMETADPSASQEKMSELFSVLQKKIYDQEILNQAIALAKGVSDLKDCPAKRDLLRAKQILETSVLTKEEVVQLEKSNQDKQDALQSKSNGFRITLPEEKEPVAKPLYYKKLGSTPERKEREKLFREFNSARAKQWLHWNFKDLVTSRNQEGVAAGFKNYYEYKFFRAQLDLKNYRSMVNEVKTKLAPKVRKALAKMAAREKISKVEGWDFRYLREKNSAGEINELLKDLSEDVVMELAERFYSPLGIEVKSYHFKMDLYPRAGKNTHAFAMGVIPPHVNEKGELLPEPKTDIRFLANLKKPVKWDDVSTLIHELGHAIHYGEIRQPLAIFRGFGSVETEAVAMLTERMAESVEYMEKELSRVVGKKAEDLKPILRRQIEASRVEQAIVLLRQVNFSDFEYEVYQNPDQDYAALWSKMMKEYWGIELAPENSDWDIDHFVMAPVYVQNYAIGILMVEQLMQSIQKDFKTTYNSKELGNKIRKEYFAPGQQFDYMELVQRFTGKPLTATAALSLLP